MGQIRWKNRGKTVPVEQSASSTHTLLGLSSRCPENVAQSNAAPLDQRPERDAAATRTAGVHFAGGCVRLPSVPGRILARSGAAASCRGAFVSAPSSAVLDVSALWEGTTRHPQPGNPLTQRV